VIFRTFEGGLPQAIRRPGGCYNRARMTLLERVQAYIDRHNLLQPGQDVLVGVSGGADSLCLLDLLRRLGFQPLIAHLDHGLRPESAREAEFVAEYARSVGCPVVLERVIPGAIRPEAAGSLEAAARQARYRFFTKVAGENGLDTIATGHTMDDQAETVLLHILRGSGLDGLRGMLPVTDLGSWQMLPDSENLRLVRPLLAEPHTAAVEYCEKHGLQIQVDLSNRDLDFTRNRIRHELLPLLESYNPRIREALSRLADITREDVAFIQDLAQAVRPEIMHEAAGGWEVVRVGDFVRQPTAIQRGLLRELLAELAGQDVEFSLEDIERCRGYILEPERPRSLQLSGSIRAVNAGSSVRFETTDGLGFSRTYPQTGDAIPCQLAVPGSLHLGGGWTIQSCWEEAAGDRSAWLQRGWPHRIVLDGALIDEGLTVRNRRPGDRIRLLGASGRQKISDLMIDRKIPLAARERWPLLAAGDEIIWVVGLARSDIGTVLANAKNGLVIEVVPPDDPTTRRRSGG